MFVYLNIFNTLFIENLILQYSILMCKTLFYITIIVSILSKDNLKSFQNYLNILYIHIYIIIIVNY